MQRLLAVIAAASIGLTAWATGGARPAAAATTITVTSNADTGGSCTTFPTDCTLRQAFVEASSGGAAQGDDVEIVLTPGLGTIGLASEVLYDGGTGGAHTMSIVGNGATVTRSGTDPYRLVESSGTGLLTVDGVTMTNGNSAPPSSSGYGGAILTAGDLTVTDARFEANVAFSGGAAVFAGGALIVADTVFTGNYIGAGIYAADGGVATAGGSASITRAVFVDNTAVAVAAAGDAAIAESTFERNGICYYKGGVGAVDVGGHVGIVGSTFVENCGTVGAVAGGSVTVVTSTFVDNRVAASYSGTINASGPVAVVASTFTQDGAAAALNSVLRSDTSIALYATVLQWTGVPYPYTLCSAPSVTSLGYNFANESADTCALTAAGDSSDDGNDPSLSALADNGGPTETRRPREHSPLLDAIPDAACAAGDALAGTTVVTDQRGYPRPERAGGACDIGAVEVQVGEPLEPAPPVLGPNFTG